MPYVISFEKVVQIADPGQYINECCVGGDVVLDRLLPELRSKYGTDLVSEQEDWGWFAWFEESGTKLAVDVHTDDPKAGEFRIHLTSRKPRFLLGAKVQDSPELLKLRDLVLSQLQNWPVDRLRVEHADENYMPIESAV
jgi:hypothetical protein